VGVSVTGSARVAGGLAAARGNSRPEQAAMANPTQAISMSNFMRSG
jgi:hypothetical protein